MCGLNDTQCSDVCASKGYTNSSLIYHDRKCPFETFCSCSCDSKSACLTQCSKGQLATTTLTKVGCHECKCQCPSLEHKDCESKCMTKEVQILNITHGCQECNCNPTRIQSSRSNSGL